MTSPTRSAYWRSRSRTNAALLDQNWSRWASRFDALSVTQYLDQHKAKIGAPFARMLMENGDPDQVRRRARQSSALHLLLLLPVVDGEHVEVLGYSDERHVVEGGVGRLRGGSRRNTGSSVMPAIAGETIIERDTSAVCVRARPARLVCTPRSRRSGSGGSTSQWLR